MTEDEKGNELGRRNKVGEEMEEKEKDVNIVKVKGNGK